MAHNYQQEQQASQQNQQSVPDIGTLTTRLRLIEEKTTNLNRKLELLESNLVVSTKKLNETVRAQDSDILELKREIDDIKQKIMLIIRELKLSAGKDELNTVKRYLDIWNLARFATREEVEHIIEEKLNEVLKKH